MENHESVILWIMSKDNRSWKSFPLEVSDDCASESELDNDLGQL